MGLMSHDEYVHAIRREGDAMANAARAAGVGAASALVPAVERRRSARAPRTYSPLGDEHHRRPVEGTRRGLVGSETPTRGELLDWFAGGVAPLADALRGAGPNLELWTWTPDKSSRFWARRQANETAVHRYDAQLAVRA